jgi:hypothetical protein
MSLLPELQNEALKHMTRSNFEVIKGLIDHLQVIIKDELEDEPDRQKLFNDFFVAHKLKTRVQDRVWVWHESEIVLPETLIGFLHFFIHEYEEEITFSEINTILMAKHNLLRVIPIQVTQQVRTRSGDVKNKTRDSYMIHRIAG